MSSGQKPLFDLADWDDVSDDFKAAAKTAYEKIFGETSVGLKTQFSVWKTRLQTETEPKMRRKLEAAIAAAQAVA